jgi:hypothetical protein
MLDLMTNCWFGKYKFRRAAAVDVSAEEPAVVLVSESLDELLLLR